MKAKTKRALGIMSAFQRSAAIDEMRYLFARDFADAVGRGRSTADAFAAAREAIENNAYTVASDFDADARERGELQRIDFPSYDGLVSLWETYGVPQTRDDRRQWAVRAANNAPRADPSTQRATPRPRTPTARARQEALTQGTATFDLPPDKRTLEDFKKMHPEGVLCTKLPQEGGPYTYKICAKSSEINGGREITLFDVEAVGRKSGKAEGFVSAALATGGSKRTYKVGWASVVNIDYTEREKPPEEREPSGLGTRMYERALRAVCDVGKAYAITSDTTRSEFSEAFWQKQVRKGRARCVGDGTQSNYFRTPMRKAREQYAEFEGEKDENDNLIQPLYDGPRFEKYRAGLPSPEDNGSGTFKWSCDYYEMLCKDRPDSLDGLRIKSFTKSKRRKR